MIKTSIFAGGFGSGKSELALNYIMQTAKEVKNLVLADLDLINPYFASRELRSKLEQMGIRMVAPGGELSFGDVPSIPGEIIGMLRQDNHMVIDVAGDEAGALVLAYLNDYIVNRGNYDFLLVINPYRPFARDLNSITEMKERLESASRIKFTAIVSNPNLLEKTTVDTIRQGHMRVDEYAQALNLPLACLTVEKRFYNELLPDYKEIIKAVELNLRPDWL